MIPQSPTSFQLPATPATPAAPLPSGWEQHIRNEDAETFEQLTERALSHLQPLKIPADQELPEFTDEEDADDDDQPDEENQVDEAFATIDWRISGSQQPSASQTPNLSRVNSKETISRKNSAPQHYYHHQQRQHQLLLKREREQRRASLSSAAELLRGDTLLVSSPGAKYTRPQSAKVRSNPTTQMDQMALAFLKQHKPDHSLLRSQK